MLQIKSRSTQRRFRNSAGAGENIELLRREPHVQHDYLLAQSLVSDVMMSGYSSIDFSHLENLIELPSSISRCETLRDVNLSNTSVYDLGPLSSLRGLRKVSAYFTPVSTLDFLSNLESLEWLCLSATKVDDISVIGRLPALRYLDISHTDISSVAALSRCSYLSELILRDTKISSVDELVRLKNLSILDISLNEALNFNAQNFKTVKILIN